MTMPEGIAEEPMLDLWGSPSRPFHVVSTNARPGKTVAPEFGRWRTFLVTNAVGADLAVPGAKRIANRSLRRHRLLIKVNPSVTPTTTTVASSDATVAVGAASAANVSLPNANSAITGFVLTLSAAGTVAGTVTVTNVPGGPLVYDVPIGATSLAIQYSQPIQSTGTAINVAVSAITGAGAGHINVTGQLTTPGTAAQPTTDGCILGSREEIAALIQGGGAAVSNPLNLYTAGGYLQIGDNVRCETQQEMWVAYAPANTAPVVLTVFDEQYASDAESAFRRDKD